MKKTTRRKLAYLLFPWMISSLVVVELFIDICEACQTALWVLLNMPLLLILLLSKQEVEKKEREMKKIWLNGQWYIDYDSTPYVLFDSIGMVQNGKSHPLGYACKHRTSGGFCHDCWNKFIEAGLKAIRIKK